MKPVLIGIGGACSGSGKTTCASLLLKNLRGWGAIKFTKTPPPASLIIDPEKLAVPGKDTRRLMDAGAESVVWVRSPRSELQSVLPDAVERLSACRGIIVEGNSAIEFLKPDIIIFTCGYGTGRLKESGANILRKAEIVVFNSALPPASSKTFQLSYQDILKQGPGTARFFLIPRDEKAFIGQVEEMIAEKERIRAVLTEKSRNGKLPCSVARKIALDLGVSIKEIGRTANDLKIKITDCELGCF